MAAAVVVAGLFALLAANEGQMPRTAVPMVAVVLALFAVLAVVGIAMRRGG